LTQRILGTGEPFDSRERGGPVLAGRTTPWPSHENRSSAREEKYRETGKKGGEKWR